MVLRDLGDMQVIFHEGAFGLTEFRVSHGRASIMPRLAVVVVQQCILGPGAKFPVCEAIAAMTVLI